MGVRYAFVLLAIVGLAGCLATTKPPIAWDAEKIASAQHSHLQLWGPDKQTIATVSTDRVKKIVDATRRIERVAGVTTLVYIFDGKDPNAFATQYEGVNRIGVTIGMLDLLGDDEDAYAAVIGHELAHLVLRHGSIRKEREGVRTSASNVLGAILNAAGVPMGATVVDLASTAISAAFSRDEEREADSHGMRYATEAGFDPQGAVRAWERMSGHSGLSIPFLSTHPMAQERLETMRQLAAAAPWKATPAKPVTPSAQTSAPAKPAPPAVASVKMARLRPLGQSAPALSLPAGTVFIDMNSIESISSGMGKRALLIINLHRPEAKGERSLRVSTVANCDSKSLSVVRVVSTSKDNGEGDQIEAKDLVQGLNWYVSPWLEAVASACNG